MIFEELVENLVFSATYPGPQPGTLVTAGMLPRLSAHNWSAERLAERYGALEFRRMLLLLELAGMVAELRREVSRSIASEAFNVRIPRSLRCPGPTQTIR